MPIVKIVTAAALLIAFGATVRAASLTIEQSGQHFSDRSATISHGDSLTFSNADDVSHNIIVVDEAEHESDLGLQKPGEKLTFEFDRAGRFKIRCNIHPGMKMNVTVK